MANKLTYLCKAKDGQIRRVTMDYAEIDAKVGNSTSGDKLIKDVKLEVFNVDEKEVEHASVSAAHRAPLALASTIAADIASDWEAICRDGAYLETRHRLQTHPAVKRMDALRRDYLKALSLLGLRAAVSDEMQTPGESLEDILNG